MHFTRLQKYRVPEDLIRFLCGFPDEEVLEAVVRHLQLMQIPLGSGVHFQDQNPENDEKHCEELPES